MEIVSNNEMKLLADKIVFLETDEKTITSDLCRNVIIKRKIYAY